MNISIIIERAIEAKSEEIESAVEALVTDVLDNLDIDDAVETAGKSTIEDAVGEAVTEAVEAVLA